jgi:DNA-binding NarL/FixJ family response regulator
MKLRAGQLEASADMPAVVMSSACDSSTITQLVALGIQRVIVKPFKLKTLLEAVRALSCASSPVAASETAA